MSIITIECVQKLLQRQFQELKMLDLFLLNSQGRDNITYKCGDYLLRFPSSHAHAQHVGAEQTWLPILLQSLSCAIPEFVALGRPDAECYPYDWLIYRWIDGVSADHVVLGMHELEALASDLADFLIGLHLLDPLVLSKRYNADLNLLKPSANNFWRGGSLQNYNIQMLKQIQQLKDILGQDRSTKIWHEALHFSRKEIKEQFVHGDLSSGNLLLRDNKLCAVIDFGQIAVGDIACDLAIAWTLFNGNSRAIFQQKLNLPNSIWARAKGWVLWKAMHELCNCADYESDFAKKQLSLIHGL